MAVIILFCSVLICSWTLTGCQIKMPEQIQTLVDVDESYEKDTNVDLEYIADKASLYEKFDDSKVVTAYLIVGYGNEADGTDHTWTELNYRQPDDTEGEPQEYKCEAALQFGDEYGPCEGMFGYDTLSANAVICLQGNNAETKPQKSYRIEIKKGKGSVDGMKKLVFSKSLSDPFRFTEKLCADLMQEIPGMLSTRTRFVHLYVKDKTQSQDTRFVDYGLYTMIEAIDKTYFKNRDLSKDGSLYKLENFDWSRHEEVIVPGTDASYDIQKFEQLLEVKGDSDHNNLIEMLEDVNDENVPMKEVVDKWFDEKNLYHYLAFHLLTGKKDAAEENCYLYQPQGTDRFYLLSWDNDSAFREEYEKSVNEEEIPEWNRGIFPLLSSVFYQKLLKDETCRSNLAESVDDLYENYITKEVCEKKAKALARRVKPYLFTLPDAAFLKVKEADYDRLVAQLGEQAETNYYTFYETLEKPWPFHILAPETEDGHTTLKWEDSYYYGKNVSYHVLIDDTWDFKTPLMEKEGYTQTKIDISDLPPGQYFIKISAAAKDGKEQEAYEWYYTEVGTTVYGTLCFYVMEDGTAHASYMDQEE